MEKLAVKAQLTAATTSSTLAPVSSSSSNNTQQQQQQPASESRNGEANRGASPLLVHATAGTAADRVTFTTSNSSSQGSANWCV